VEQIGVPSLWIAGGFMSKAWNTPILVVGTVYFIIDGVFSYVTQPMTSWLSKKRFLVSVRIWATSFGAYPSLALFAVPLIILEPAKPLSAYLIATGHFFAGAVVFITAEVLKLTVIDRLFRLNKKKLLSIPAVAWGYSNWRRMMDWLESTRAWQASRSIVIKAIDWARELSSKAKTSNLGIRRTSALFFTTGNNGRRGGR
jgi:hypothetical protein